MGDFRRRMAEWLKDDPEDVELYYFPPLTEKEAVLARTKFLADEALFDRSGIYEVLDRVLAESRFLATVEQPVPNLRMVPPIWTPRDATSEQRLRILAGDHDNSPVFFALVRWNRKQTPDQGMRSFWDEYYPVETWRQIAVHPDAKKRIITVSAAQDIKIDPDFWEDPANLVMLLRWCRDNPDFRGTTADNYYLNYRSGMPNFSGTRIHPNRIA